MRKTLATFELALRASLKSGWQHTWSERGVWLTEKEIASLPTEELGKACFASGLPANLLLLYTNPNFAIRRLEVLHKHKGYAELFRRPDVWKGLIAAMEFHVSQLDPRAERAEGTDNINPIRGLRILPVFYAYPSIRKSITGHEKEMISAHIRALEKLITYHDSQLFSLRVAPVLIKYGLALGKSISPQQYAAACSVLSQYGWGKDYDQAIKELRRFVTVQQKDGKAGFTQPATQPGTID